MICPICRKRIDVNNWPTELTVTTIEYLCENCFRSMAYNYPEEKPKEKLIEEAKK